MTEHNQGQENLLEKFNTLVYYVNRQIEYLERLKEESFKLSGFSLDKSDLVDMQNLFALLENSLASEKIQNDLLWTFSESLEIIPENFSDFPIDPDLESAASPSTSGSPFGDAVDLEKPNTDEMIQEELKEASKGCLRVFDSWRNSILDLYVGIHLLKNSVYEMALEENIQVSGVLIKEVFFLEENYERLVSYLQPIFTQFAEYHNEPVIELPHFSRNLLPSINIKRSQDAESREEISDMYLKLQRSGFTRQDLERFVARLRWHHLSPCFAGGSVTGVLGSILAKFFLGFGFFGAAGLAALSGCLGFYAVKNYPLYSNGLSNQRRPLLAALQRHPNNEENSKKEPDKQLELRNNN